MTVEFEIRFLSLLDTQMMKLFALLGTCLDKKVDVVKED